MKLFKHINYQTTLDKNIRIIKLPKYAGLKLLNKLNLEYIDKRNYSNQTYDFKSNIILYPNQIIISNNIEEKLKKRKTNSYILIQKPGLGKTIIALNIINLLKVKVLIIVPNLFLFNQWKLEILDNFDITEEEILEWNGKMTSKKKKNLTIYNSQFKIIITTIHTALKIDPQVLNENNVCLCIYDEIHLYCSPLFSKCFQNTQRYYNLGLSATATRNDTFEKIYLQHLNILSFSNKIVNEENSQFIGCVFIIRNQQKYENIMLKNGNISVPLILNNIIEDEKRNDLIIQNIIKLYDDNIENYIYVFSDRRSHLQNLAKNLNIKRNDIKVFINGNENELNELCEIKVLLGGCTLDDVIDAKNNARIIFTTYQLSSVGVNIVKMNCLMFATPRKSNFKQIIGRILRNGSNVNIHRKIIDIVDMKSILYNQYHYRKKEYIDHKFEIINVK